MKEPKKYRLKLTEAIKINISVFHEKNAKESSGNYNTSKTAKIFRIDDSNFGKYLRGDKAIPFPDLLSFISMPWVTEKEAQRWVFLWVADMIDSTDLHKFKALKRSEGKDSTARIFDKKDKQYIDYGIPLLDSILDKNGIPWTPDKQNERLDKWATSLDKLANYTDTLGIIDQIDLARKRQRNVIKNSGYVEEGYCVPVQGPNVTSIDFDKPCASKIKILQKRHEPRRSDKRQESITALVLKFAKDLAELEAKNRITEVEGYLQDELNESYLEDEIDRYNEEDQEIALTDLDLEVSKHVEANKSADDIMALLKYNQKNLES